MEKNVLRMFAVWGFSFRKASARRWGIKRNQFLWCGEFRRGQRCRTIWLSSLLTSRGKCTRGAFIVEVLVPPTASQSHWIVVGCRRKVQKAACPFSLNFQTLLWCLHFDLLPKWDQGVVNYSRRRNKVSALFVREKKVCPGLWRTR